MMILTMLSTNLRRTVISRTSIITSFHHAATDPMKITSTCAIPVTLFIYPNSQYSTLRNREISHSSFLNHSKYPMLFSNIKFNKTNHVSNFLPTLYTSSLNTNAHCREDKLKLLAPPQVPENLGSIRKGHHLLQKSPHSVPLPTSTHDFQGLPSSVSNLNTRYDSQITQARNVNIPKLIFDASPSSFQPYLQLIRFDKPIGTWLLYWPCAWSISLAAQPGCWPDFYLLALFGAGAFFMRGAGCIINDMWDKDFDIKVERTKDRPLACDRITYPQAFAFLASQLSISLAILLQLNWYSVGLGFASIGIVITYPAFKRFTYWPQIALGLAFNYGALLGWAAVHGSCDWSICLPLYFLCHMWTMIYDTIYAHQDKTDDILVGVKSTALRFGDQTKPWLTGFTAAMAGGLLYVGHLTDMTWPYYTGATITIASIAAQLYRLDIDNPEACGDAFRFHFYMGLLMFGTIMAGNLAKPKKKDEEKDGKELKQSSFSGLSVV